MKRLLSVCVLSGIFLLSACGNSSGVIVCTDEDDAINDSVRAYHEDGEITSIVMTQTEDISNYDEETIGTMTAMFEAMDEVDDYSIDDGILTMTMTLEGEAIQTMIPGSSLDLDDFINQIETEGVTCN